MTNQSTIDKLIEMRLSSMADAFRIQMDDSTMKEVPFEDRFGMLVDVEYTNRKNNRLKRGSKAFSGVSPPIPGVLYSFTSLFRRTPYFPGVSLNLLVFLVFTRFYWSSPLFAGVPYLNHQIFFKLHQLFLKLPITFIAMLDASMVAPYFQCYD